jgi:hypothetical protein
MQPQSLVGEQRRQQHDEQRPEIVEETGFRRGRQPQRGKIQRMVAEEAADPEPPDLGRLPQRRRSAGPQQPAHGADAAADREGEGRQLKWRHAAGRDRQQRQERPHQNGGEADQGGAKASGHRRECGAQGYYSNSMGIVCGARGRKRSRAGSRINPMLRI